MKTALTQLIEKWESEMGSYIPNAPIYKAFIEEAKELLKAEKEQIIEAYEAGTKEDLFNTWRIPEEVYKKEKSAEYFQQTFKQDE